MKLSKSMLWAGALALTVALAANPVSAQEAGTITVTGTLNMTEFFGGGDLEAVFVNGNEHTWTLTLYDTTYSHFGSDSYLSYRATNVFADSFDLVFSGPDADALNAIVSEQLEGGEAYLQLFHYPAYSSAGLNISLWRPGGTSWLWTGYEWSLDVSLFPSDAYGYPIVESEPHSVYVEQVQVGDSAGVYGYIISWDNTLTIAGDLGTPIPATMSIADGAVNEGDRGSMQLGLWVTLTNTSDQTITVNYRTVDGTAVSAGSRNKKADYSTATGTLTFQPGETMKTITISVKSDRAHEANETFTVELFDVSGTTIADGVATVTIRNDD